MTNIAAFHLATRFDIANSFRKMYRKKKLFAVHYLKPVRKYVYHCQQPRAGDQIHISM